MAGDLRHRQVIRTALQSYEIVRDKRRAAFQDWQAARTAASEIKTDAVNHLDSHLTEFAAKLEARGTKVHWASTGKQARDLITQGIAAVIAQGRRPIALGGDHSVTFPVLRAIAAAHGPVTLLHIDAHPDLYEEFEGDRFSHACPFARIMEAGLASRLVQVGIRTINAHQRAQAARHGVEVIDMRAWALGARPQRLSGPIYCSIDIDGLDPAFAPGVSHREPGGLSVREVLALVHALPDVVVGADVVEYNPDTDVGGVTAPVAAKLVKELAGRMLDGR